MSQENLEVVIRASRAVTGQNPDYDTVDALYHPQHVLSRSLPASWARRRLWERGVIRRGCLRTSCRPRSISKELSILGPDTVLSVATVRGRGASSGIDIEQRLWAVVTVTAKQITRTVIYADPAEALEAIGRTE